jgi:hypothetical protein
MFVMNRYEQLASYDVDPELHASLASGPSFVLDQKIKPGGCC